MIYVPDLTISNDIARGIHSGRSTKHDWRTAEQLDAVAVTLSESFDAVIKLMETQLEAVRLEQAWRASTYNEIVRMLREGAHIVCVNTGAGQVYFVSGEEFEECGYAQPEDETEDEIKGDIDDEAAAG